MMLNKDFTNRPDIFDVGRIPRIKKHILSFVKRYNLTEEVISVLDIEDAKLMKE